MKFLQRFSGMVLAVVVLAGSFGGNFADAMGDGTAGAENAVYLDTSPENKLNLLESAEVDSEVLYTFRSNEGVQVNHIESSYTYAVYTDKESGEETKGYVLTEELNQRADGKYVLASSDNPLSFWGKACAESNKVFDLMEDTYLNIQKEYKFVNISYTDETTSQSYTGYVNYDELSKLTDKKNLKEIEDHLTSLKGINQASAKNIEKPVIVDISHWQNFTKSNYDQIAKQADLVIVRVSQGITKDRKYTKHISELKKRSIPVNVYSYVTNAASMEKQAKFFYNTAKEYSPAMYWIDAEESHLTRSKISAYVKTLRGLVGNSKIGVYAAHGLYKKMNINVSEVDAVWIPRYGKNTGYYDKAYNPMYNCDLHQYTSTGRLKGYSGNLDLSRLTGTKKLSFFTTKKSKKKSNSKVTYYTSNPGKIILTSGMNVYKDLNMKKKAGKKLAKGTTITVSSVKKNSSGTSVLKVSGGYISAKQIYSSPFHSENPGTIILASRLNIYKDINLKNKTGNKLAKGVTVAVKGIAYNNKGTPRLKVNGGYINAKVKYSSKFYYSNPGIVKLKSKLNIYKDKEFKKKTGKSLSKGATVKIKGIVYSKTGVPRLKVNGGYISGQAKYSYKYFYINPGSIKTARTLSVYKNTKLKSKTGKKYKSGTTVKIKGIAYSSTGVPRLKVNGGYISAKSEYFK